MKALIEKHLTREEWKEVCLEEICGITSKLVDPREELYLDMLHIGGGNIESQTGELADLRTAREEALISGKFPFDDSMVLYSKIRPYLMKVSRPNFKGLCSADIYPLSPIKRILDRNYLFYLLLTPDFTKYAIQGSERAGMPKVNRNHLFKYKTQIPPLPEQERIVAILDEAFEGIATATAHAERNLHNARELFQSVLQSTFQQKGEDWVEATLGDTVAETCTLSYGIVQPGKEYQNGLPIIRPTDMSQKMIGLQGLKRIDPELADSYTRTSLKGGEILLCVRGSTGLLSIAASELVGANVTRGIVPIQFTPEKIDQEFGFYLLLGPPTQTQIREKTYGAALLQINIRDVRKIALRFPPLKTQKAIVKKLDALATETRRLEAIYQRKLEALAEFKQSLLQRAFAGEL